MKRRESQTLSVRTGCLWVVKRAVHSFLSVCSGALKMKTAKSPGSSKYAAGVSKGKEAKTGKPDAVLKKKGSAVLVQQVVSIWEDLRPRQASAEVKQKLVSDILKVGKGKLKELAVKSKSSRVIQALLKNGTTEQRQKIWSECKDHIVEISMSPYGNHVVRKFISIASKEQLSGVVRTLPGFPQTIPKTVEFVIAFVPINMYMNRAFQLILQRCNSDHCRHRIWLPRSSSYVHNHHLNSKVLRICIA